MAGGPGFGFGENDDRKAGGPGFGFGENDDRKPTAQLFKVTIESNPRVPRGSALFRTVGLFSQTASPNNGNTTGVIANGAQTFNRSYTYDSLNRLATMSAPGDQCSGLSWTIDPWGNRTNQTPTGGTCWSFSSTVGTNNQLGAPYAYDAAGNMIYDGTHSYTYDAENRLIAVDGGNTATYVYDAQTCIATRVDYGPAPAKPVLARQRDDPLLGLETK